MLTQLTTVKSRLALDPLDTTYDDLLTSAILAVSARFDRETNRTLARTVDATCEFRADSCRVVLPCYPVETISKFELKTSETAGWSEAPEIEYLLLQHCVVALATPFSLQPLAFSLSRRG